MSNQFRETHATLRDGRTATIRLLQATDVEPLAAYFLSLSDRTKSFYGPHPFDRATAEKLCATTDHAVTLRFVAVLNDGSPQAEVIGYMILTREIWKDDVQRYGDKLRVGECACFAPSIADAYQGQGLGTQMGRHVIACAKQWGVRQVILMGGVQARNERAQRLYSRLGFRRVGEFWTHGRETLLNYDMAMEF